MNKGEGGDDYMMSTYSSTLEKRLATRVHCARSRSCSTATSVVTFSRNSPSASTGLKVSKAVTTRSRDAGRLLIEAVRWRAVRVTRGD